MGTFPCHHEPDCSSSPVKEKKKASIQKKKKEEENKEKGHDHNDHAQHTLVGIVPHHCEPDHWLFSHKKTVRIRKKKKEKRA